MCYNEHQLQNNTGNMNQLNIPNTHIKLHQDSLTSLLDTDLWDNRLLNCVLFQYDQRYYFNSKEMYGVNIYKYAELSGLSRGKAYEKVVASAKKLQEASVTVTLVSGEEVQTSLIYDVSYSKANKSVGIYWNPDFIPLISGSMPPGEFFFPAVKMVTLPARQYRLYLLLEKSLWKLEKEGRIVLTRTEIREVAKLESGSYMQWGNVTSRLIRPTIQSLEDKLYRRLVYTVRGESIIFTEERMRD